MSGAGSPATGSFAQEIKPEPNHSRKEDFVAAVDGTETAAGADQVPVDDRTQGSGGAPEPGDPSRFAEIRAELAMTPGRNRMYDLGM